MSPRPALVLASLAILAVGCGARTGLGVDPRDGGVVEVEMDAFVPVDAPPDAPPDSPPDSPPDAPPDAPPPDAPSCIVDSDCDDRISCTIDTCERGRCAVRPDALACDDGLFCTGEEQCVLGVGCISDPPVCADPVACTVDRCDEALDACVSDPDVTLCPISHRCDPVRGCVARALAHDPTTLYEIDLPSGELHVLGPTVLTLTDVALHPDGTLYGAITGALVRVDYVAMTVERIVDVTGSFNALDISPDGTLYGAVDDRVVRFDVSRGTVTTVSMFPPRFFTSGDLAFVEGRLFATATSRLASDDVLVELSITGGTPRIVGRIGHGCVWGLAPFGTTLYGLTCEGKLLSIDVRTGAAVVLSRGSAEFYGAGAR